jgi:hypothetical protein
VCWRHGANRNPHNGSTAFGSEFERTTATLPLRNHHHTSIAVITTHEEERNVPGEVTILCQEIVEV